MKFLGKSLLVLLLVTPLIGNSQNSNGSQPEPIKLEQADTWQDLKTKNGVKVQYKYQECHDNTNDTHKENVMLRFENTTDQQLTVEWKHLLWYDGECDQLGVDDPEFREKISLKAGEVKKGGCNEDTPQQLKVFSEFLEKGNGKPDTKLTGIRLANMKVK